MNIPRRHKQLHFAYICNTDAIFYVKKNQRFSLIKNYRLSPPFSRMYLIKVLYFYMCDRNNRVIGSPGSAKGMIYYFEIRFLTDCFLLRVASLNPRIVIKS